METNRASWIYSSSISNYIQNVPWNSHPAFSNQQDGEAYLNAFRKVCKNIPGASEVIDFKSDAWDFNPCFSGIDDYHLRLSFKDFPEPLVDKVKFFVLYKINDFKHISTINARLTCLKAALNHTLEETGLSSPLILTTQDLIDHVENLDIGHQGKHSYYIALADFYRFYSLNYSEICSINYQRLFDLSAEEKKLAKATNEKLPNIPAEYLAQIVSTATAVMDNKEAEHNDRVTACILIILSQTGMRISDVLNLKIDCLETLTLKSTGLNCAYIKYTCQKNNKANKELVLYKTTCNELCQRAIKTLLYLHKINPKAQIEGSNFLCIYGPNRLGKLLSIPTTKDQYSYYQKQFFYNYLREPASKNWEGVPKPVCAVTEIFEHDNTAAIKRAEEILSDPCFTNNDKLIANIILIRAQSKLLLKDILAIKTSSLKEMYSDDNEFYYRLTIDYDSTKTGTITYECSHQVSLYIKNIIQLSAPNRIPNISKDHICVLNYRRKTEKGKPLGYNYCLQLQHELLGDIPFDESGPRKKANGPSRRIKVNLSIPDTRQYRVAVCTALYEAGVSLVYIQECMAHLSDTMQGYYVRPKDHFQEEFEAAERFISSVVVDGDTPIGLLGEEFRQNIIDYLNEKDQPQVFENIESILDALGDNIIIRSKLGGACYCVKATIKPCAKDARTNKALCAYGSCPNIYYLYHTLDITWSDYKRTVETYNQCKKIGRKMEYQTELSKIRDIIRNRILPQLDQMDKAIERNGKDFVTSKYPQLQSFIDNEEEVRSEVEKWL